MTSAPNPKGPAAGAPSKKEVAPGWARFLAAVSIVAIVAHLLLRFFTSNPRLVVEGPLYAALMLGGAPLVLILVRRLWVGEFGSDFLAGASIVTAVLLREYLVATIVVLMRFANRYLADRDICDRRSDLSVRDARHALRECFEHARSPPGRECFKRRSAPQHRGPSSRDLSRGWKRHRGPRFDERGVLDGRTL